MTTSNTINVSDAAALAMADAMTMDATTTKGAKGGRIDASASIMVTMAKAETYGRTALMNAIKGAISAHTNQCAQNAGTLCISLSVDVTKGATMADVIKALKANVRATVENTGAFVATFKRVTTWEHVLRLSSIAARPHINAGAVDAIAFVDAFKAAIMDAQNAGTECTPENVAALIADAKKASTKDGAKREARIKAQKTAVENAATNKALEIARGLKAAGVAAEIIAMTTGLAIDAINAL